MSLEKGIYIRLIKGFKFPEPVFHPESLERNLRFLADPQEMKKRINLMGKSRYEWEVIQNFGGLKPIRNPWVKYDQFWEPFQHSQFSETQELGFRMYPFQIVPLPSERVEIHIQKTLFEKIFNTKFQSIYPQYQIRLYPPGVGTVHLIIHLKLPIDFDIKNIEKLLNILLKRKREWLNAPFIIMEKLKVRLDTSDDDSASIYKTDNQTMNFFQWTNYMYSKILNQISNHTEETREIDGYVAVINLQGFFPTPEIRRILENYARRKKGSSVFLEKDYDDIINLCGNLLFLYIDSALSKHRRWRYLENPDFIIHGRRGFRGYLINVAELGYCSAYLLKFYNKIFKGLLGNPPDSKWIPTLEKVVNISSYLKLEQWKKTYACELYEHGINETFVKALRDTLKDLSLSTPVQPRVDGILSKLVPLSQLLLAAAIETYRRLGGC
ncbi:hypothetical protein KAW48_09805 [candidate division WOR-3 bacterium]|nr:hypothetical protein [candidate division WOR-3 bacterium]